MRNCEQLNLDGGKTIRFARSANFKETQYKAGAGDGAAKGAGSLAGIFVKCS